MPHQTHFRSKYLDGGKLEEALDKYLGKAEWERIETLITDKGREYVVLTKHELSEDQLEKIWKECQMYFVMRRENEAIRVLQNESIKPPIRSHRETNHRPKDPSNETSIELAGLSKTSSQQQIEDSEGENFINHKGDFVVDSIPTLSANDCTIPENMGFKIHGELKLALFASSEGKQMTGLYSTVLDVGETASVFDVRAYMWLEGDQRHGKGNMVHKLAIKRLKQPTNLDEFAAEFRAEHEALLQANKLGHPNIVETLSVFKHEDNGLQYFNFAFPLAVGNLKRLCRGDYSTDRSVVNSCQSLWHQFAPLTSAVAFLHESMSMAHRDIKPSNILVYPSTTHGELSLRIADFGLAVDLTKAISWELGSVAAQSAQTYDAPEMGKIKIPSATQLLSNDVWKLGCVFIELATFLASGPQGVVDFRSHITTTDGKIRNDYFNDTRFDDGEKVKPEVLEWMDTLSTRGRLGARVSQLSPILKKMLAKSAERPSARDLFSALSKLLFSGLSYDDGQQILTFREGDTVSSLSRFNQARHWFENWVRQPVDWAPFPEMPAVCSWEEGVLSWSWRGKSIDVVIPRDQIDRYKATTVPLLGNRITLALPSSKDKRNDGNANKAAIHNHDTGYGRDGHTSTGPVFPVSEPPRTDPERNPTSTSVDLKEENSWPFTRYISRLSGREPTRSDHKEEEQFAWDIHCCVNRLYTEPLQTVLRVITHRDLDDQRFFEELRSAIRSTAGWPRRFLSLKRCCRITFVEFKMGYQKEWVTPLREWALPPNGEGWRHGISEQIWMHSLSAAIVAGVHDPQLGQNVELIVNKLPMKQLPPGLSRDFQTPGWGLLVIMGISWKKILLWVAFFISCNCVFAGLWLHFFGATQLTTAVVGVGLGLTVLGSCLTVANKADDTWHSKVPEIPKSQSQPSATPLEQRVVSSDMHLPEQSEKGLKGVPNFSRREPFVATH